MDFSSPKKGFPKKRCGVLGCTGSVGQRFSLLLAEHPHFELVAVGASERSSGKTYKEATTWKTSGSMPENIGELTVTLCDPQHFKHCDVVFSGLDSSVAGEVEDRFLKENIPVFSNAKNHRQDPSVPLVVPTVNISHLDYIKVQRESNGLDKGFLVCNSNCAVIGIVIPLAAIQASCGAIDGLSVVTNQAVSGAGFPGPSMMEMMDNWIPYISGEEDKMQPESRKILGQYDVEGKALVDRTDLKVSATCNRVAVTDGHGACVSVRFADRSKVPSAEQVKQAMKDYVSEVQKMECPSAPEKAIAVMEEADRPQPKLDRDAGRGYTITVGRVREDPSGFCDIIFTALSHNTVIGASGSSILNAEAAVLKGYL
ncbi:uncharacterized protein KY384_006153 [Bacidia gigantensis]|uniref:uncharacterized protein n=1 Tax=Bacidia gigantensis TaxID=2732470 RepID=UPI001D04817C|nr:uncharacterized protein KY384_006153 [Bacidia gigantensis]KAG8529516.1 hypothetical protein KY384_006153 [Bacidia gigantensis]